jgi:hypothetical protein
MGFEVFTTVKAQIQVFWVVKPCIMVETDVSGDLLPPSSLHPEDGGDEDVFEDLLSPSLLHLKKEAARTSETVVSRRNTKRRQKSGELDGLQSA